MALSHHTFIEHRDMLQYKLLNFSFGVVKHCSPLNATAQDDFGNTPFHLAAIRGHVEIIKIFAKICLTRSQISNKNGYTAIPLLLIPCFNYSCCLRNYFVLP